MGKVKDFLLDELKTVLFVTGYFLSWFVVIGALKSLMLAQYDIDVAASALSPPSPAGSSLVLLHLYTRPPSITVNGARRGGAVSGSVAASTSSPIVQI